MLNYTFDIVMDQSKCFSSGPCAKRSGWNISDLDDALLGRSHRSVIGVARIQETLALLRSVLEIPGDYHVALTPGGVTGSFELALWNLLGTYVTSVVYDPFGRIWFGDIQNQLKVSDLRLIECEFGAVPDLHNASIDFASDVVFVHAGTATSAMIHDFGWVRDDRAGLTFCDAAASAFCVHMDWPKLDVTSFGFQKGLGCEAHQGVLVLSPRAMERFLTLGNNRPTPRLLRMTKPMFAGYTINTPSMLCIEEYVTSLRHVADNGGIEALVNKCLENKSLMDDWVGSQQTFDYLCQSPTNRSPMNSCLVLKEHELSWDEASAISENLINLEVGFDILGHTAALPCLRIWHGPTVEAQALADFLCSLTKLMEAK